MRFPSLKGILLWSLRLAVILVGLSPAAWLLSTEELQVDWAMPRRMADTRVAEAVREMEQADSFMGLVAFFDPPTERLTIRGLYSIAFLLFSALGFALAGSRVRAGKR